MNRTFDGTKFINIIKKEDDLCIKITMLNNTLPVKLRGINPEREFEVCKKENPQLFNKLILSHKISLK